VSPPRWWLRAVVDWTVVVSSLSDAPMNGGDVKMYAKVGTHGESPGASSMKPT